jgi:uncharacterized protein YuzE
MRVTFHRRTNAAYIYFTEEGASRHVAKTYACDPTQVDGMINLDFDAEGRLIGVEVLGASDKLPSSLLALGDAAPRAGR